LGSGSGDKLNRGPCECASIQLGDQTPQLLAFGRRQAASASHELRQATTLWRVEML